METGLALYNIAVVCSCRDKGAIIEERLKQCLDHVEAAFYYDQSISCSGMACMYCIIAISNKYTGSGLELVEAVGLVIVGHFSLDGQLKKEHYTEKHHNMFVVENRRELFHQLMKLFSYTGQTVVEIVTETCYSGKKVKHDVQ